MSRRRMEIHHMLCDLLGCEYEGDSCRAYFQPPANRRMIYPAIRYELEDLNAEHADNAPYAVDEMYALTLMDKNPDSRYVDELKMWPKVRFADHYVADNLNHWVFTIY